MRALDHQRFHVDQLEQHAVAVVTQAFLRAPRGDKARLGTARRVFRHSPLVHRSSPFTAPAAPLGRSVVVGGRVWPGRVRSLYHVARKPFDLLRHVFDVS